MAWIEHATSPLPRECSATELHGPNWFGAGEGNRTLVVSLEGFCSTIELHPLDQLLLNAAIFAAGDPISASTARLDAGGGGWIRTNVGARPTDLQSAPFNRSGTPPNETADYAQYFGDCQRSLAYISLSPRTHDGGMARESAMIP